MNIKYFSETDSTNNEMRRWMTRENVEDFSVVVADFQSAGRGQIGNSWESEAGQNLLMSIVVRPQQLMAKEQFFLSMAISIAIVEAVALHVPESKIKWPNDIYFGNKKMAGILIENSLRGAQIHDTIVGLGLNVNQQTFLSDAPNPTSIKNITTKEHCVSDIAEQIVERLKIWVGAVNCGDWSKIISAYMPKLYRFDGQPHPFSDSNGTFAARIDSIEPDGRLVLIDSDGVRRSYMFKEVEYII